MSIYQKLTFSQLNFVWRPKLTVISLVLLIILVYLGTWQLGRATEKAHLVATLGQRMQNNPIQLSAIANQDLDDTRFTPVRIDGIFLNNYTILLDNQIFNHQVGYRVLTPVQSPQLDKWILIDRGWIPIGSNRQTLPIITDIYGLKNVVGIINSIPSGLALQADTARDSDSWPLLVQSVDYELLTDKLHHPVYKFIVQLETNDLTAYQIMPIEFGVTQDKHLMYAVQWFLFATLLGIYYLIACIKWIKEK